jgi:hypothetical protein
MSVTDIILCVPSTWHARAQKGAAGLQASQIHHHLANRELGHLLARSNLTHPEVSLAVYPGSFCLLVWSFLLHYLFYCNVLQGILVIYCKQFFFCKPIFWPQLGLYSVPLKPLYSFYNLSKCISMFVWYISSLLMLLSCISCYNDPISNNV